MKASFDGARRNLAHDFNKLAKTKLSKEQLEVMMELRQDIGCLLCMYDDNCKDDMNDLSEKIKLDDLGQEY